MSADYWWDTVMADARKTSAEIDALLLAAVADAEKLNDVMPSPPFFWRNTIHYIVEDRHGSRVYNRLHRGRKPKRRNRSNGRLAKRDPHRKDNRYQWGKLKPFCSPTRALWINGRGAPPSVRSRRSRP